MNRLLLAAAIICAVLIGGCAKVGPNGSTVTGSASQAATDSADAMPRDASIPAMEFLAASQLPKGGTLKPGVEVAAGTYKPALTGRHVASTQWVVSETDGINRLVLDMHFDAPGTESLATLTRRLVGQHLLVILDGRVLDNSIVVTPIVHGEMVLDSDYVISVRSEIDSETVPAH